MRVSAYLSVCVCACESSKSLITRVYALFIVPMIVTASTMEQTEA